MRTIGVADFVVQVLNDLLQYKTRDFGELDLPRLSANCPANITLIVPDTIAHFLCT